MVVDVPVDEKMKKIIKEDMNPREVTILVYELFELYSNLPFKKKSGQWSLIDETMDLNSKDGGNIVKDSINFSNLGKSRNLKQYVFNYKITTKTKLWGASYKKQSFYPLMGWEKLFGKPPTKPELKEEERIKAFQKFMVTYKTSFSEKHFAVWDQYMLKTTVRKVFDGLSDKASEITRTDNLKKVIVEVMDRAKEEEKPVLEKLSGIKRLTSWHIKEEDLRLKRDKFDEVKGWTEGSADERPSDKKSDHDILRGWTDGDTTYDKILDKFEQTTGPKEKKKGKKKVSILNSVIDNRKIERNSRALENTLAITRYNFSGITSIRGGAAVIVAIIAQKQMEKKDSDYRNLSEEEQDGGEEPKPTTKMRNFQHHSFFKRSSEGSWDIVEELRTEIEPSTKEREEGKNLIELWKNNFQNGVWIKLELPSVPHAITVIIKDGKIFSAGGGYNDATIAIGGDGGFHYGDFYLYSPDHLFSDWDDQMYNAQNIVGWGFYDKKTQEKIGKYEIESKSAEGYLKVKGRKYCTIANSFFGSNCARFTNDITGKGLDVFYSSPASMAGYSFKDLNDIFFEEENAVYLKNIDEFKEKAKSVDLESSPLIINTDGTTETELSQSVKKLLMPNYSDIEKTAWKKKGLNDTEKEILYKMKKENEDKQSDINQSQTLDDSWPFKQDDRDKLDKLIEKLEEWGMMRGDPQQQGKEPDLRTPEPPQVLQLPPWPETPPSEEEDDDPDKEDKNKKRKRGDEAIKPLKRQDDDDKDDDKGQALSQKEKRRRKIIEKNPRAPSLKRKSSSGDSPPPAPQKKSKVLPPPISPFGGRKKRSRRKKKRKGKKRTRRFKK